MSLAIAQQTSASSGTGNVTSLTFTLDSSPAIGDLLLLFLGTSDYTQDREPSAPDGTWSQIEKQVNSDAELTVWSKIVQGGDGQSYQFTISGTAEKCSGIMYDISGVKMSEPIHQSDSTTNSDGTSMTTPSLTPTILGTMVFAGMTTNDTETCSGVTSGWTLDETVTPSWHATYAAHRDALTTDTTTAIYCTFTTVGTTDMPSTAIVMVRAYNAFVNVSGAWKAILDISVNVSGTWKTVADINVNANGTWKAV